MGSPTSHHHTTSPFNVCRLLPTLRGIEPAGPFMAAFDRIRHSHHKPNPLAHHTNSAASRILSPTTTDCHGAISSFIVCVCYLLEVELSAGALCSTGCVLQAETSHSPTNHHCSPSPFKVCALFLPEEDFEHAGPFMASFNRVCNVLQFESSRPLP